MSKRPAAKKPAKKKPAKKAVAAKAKKPASKAKKTKAKAAARAATPKSKAKKPAAKATKTSARKKTPAKKPAAKAAPAKKAAAKSKTKTSTVTKSAKDPAAKAAPPRPAPKPRRKARSKPVVLPPGYQPSEDEEFMNDYQVQYFREKLSTWKDEIIRQTRETLAGLTEDSVQHADIADRATSETDRALELRARDRQRKLVAKIDAALSRIDDGSYGYCEETGEPIGLKRLDARPIATLSLEAQERHERRERVYRED